MLTHVMFVLYKTRIEKKVEKKPVRKRSLLQVSLHKKQVFLQVRFLVLCSAWGVGGSKTECGALAAVGSKKSLSRRLSS